MKRKICILTLVGLVACALPGLAQNTSEKSAPASANPAGTDKPVQPEAVKDNTPIPAATLAPQAPTVTAEQALNALLHTYNLQLVSDPKTKIDLVTIKDPAAPDPLVTKIVQLKYANPSNILSSVQTVLIDKRSKVMPDVRTSQLVVLATDKEQDSVMAMVERLDTITKQVLIEARLL